MITLRANLPIIISKMLKSMLLEKPKKSAPPPPIFFWELKFFGARPRIFGRPNLSDRYGYGFALAQK